MKIGVALSGCDLGAVCALRVLRELERRGWEPSLLSACCLPALPALLYARDSAPGEDTETLRAFLHIARHNSLQQAVDNAAAQLAAGPPPKKPTAISAVSIADGKIVTFTDAYTLDSEKLLTRPLSDGGNALRAATSLMDEVDSCHLDGGALRLCDYSVWYGAPLYPMKMQGEAKTLSISFLPKYPKTPYEVLVRQLTASTGSKATVHLPIEFPARGLSLEEYEEFAVAQLESCIKRIYFKTLF